MRSLARYRQERKVAPQAEINAFYHWLHAFGMAVKSVVVPASETQAQDVREEAEILGQVVVPIGESLVVVE